MWATSRPPVFALTHFPEIGICLPFSLTIERLVSVLGMRLMRYLPLVLVALAAGCLGCGGLDSIPSYRRAQTAVAPPREPEPQRYVALDVAVIECPYGDPFLDEELWQRGDEHIDFDVQPILEENGLRVCRIGGLLPARLQALLTSPRSCSRPRRLRADLDKPTPVLVNARHPHLAIQYRDGDKARDIQLDQAQCLFEIIPGQGEDDGLKLRFRSRLRYGKALIETKVANDPGRELHWTMEHTEPTEELPALTWEMPIRPDEFLVLGTRLDRPGTFGHACFICPEKSKRTQTVLVLKASSVYGAESRDSAGESLEQAPPLAAQASLTAREHGR